MTDPIRIATPSAIQPNAEKKSLRKAAREVVSAGAAGDDIGVADSGEDISLIRLASGREDQAGGGAAGLRVVGVSDLGNAHRIR
jgi:hypothetical protein